MTMTHSHWKREVLRRFPNAEFIEESDGVTARANDADCGWWIASATAEDDDHWISGDTWERTTP
jgi:hypothetical protein